MRHAVCGFAALLLLAAPAQAEMSGGKIKIGVLTDLSGPYEQNSGVGSVEAAKMAADEFGNTINGVPVEIVSADHQNKLDIGAAIARRWFDLDGVDAVTDLVNSAVGFAVLEIAKTNNKAVLLTSAGSADFTGKACAPNTSVHWVYDSYEIGSAIGQALPQLGKTWFFITADYVFGRALQEGATAFIEKNGGKVMGSMRHPLGTSDFSSFMLQAQASKADVVAIANGGDDAINAVKTAREFGITDKQKVVPFGLDSLPAIHATSLQLAQGMTYVSPWLPGFDDAAKGFFAKFVERRHTAPSSFQVGTYSAVRSYLKAVALTNSDDPKTVFAKMRETKVDDAFTPNGTLRPDGRMVHDVYLVQIKAPAESQSEWDLLKLSPPYRATRPSGRWRKAAVPPLRHDDAEEGRPLPGRRRFASLQPNRGLAGKFFFTPPQPRRDCAVLLLYRLLPPPNYWLGTAANPGAPLWRRPDIAGREIARGDHAHFLRVGIRVSKANRTTAALSAERGMSLLPSDGSHALQQGGPPALVRARARLFACAV